MLFYKSDIVKQYVKNVIHIDTPGWDEKNKWLDKQKGNSIPVTVEDVYEIISIRPLWKNQKVTNY